MKKIAKYLLSLVMVMSIVVLPAISLAAGPTVDDLGAGSTGELSNLKLATQNPMTTATNIINTLMMFLGLIAVVIILLAGFKWMTAAGNDEEITKAKKLLSSGVIGLIIILSAWGISLFIMEIIVSSSGTRIISMP